MTVSKEIQRKALAARKAGRLYLHSSMFTPIFRLALGMDDDETETLPADYQEDEKKAKQTAGADGSQGGG